MRQLELSFFAGTLREAIQAYMARHSDELAEGTVNDYDERAGWLCKVLGECRSLGDISFDLLEHVVDKHGPKGAGLKNVTIKARFKFLRMVMFYAEKRGRIPKGTTPDMPKLRDDASRPRAILTVEQFARFREQLPPGRYRRVADMCFWTGHHNVDLWSAKWKHVEPDYEWRDEHGTLLGRGRYWRRNQKNTRCVEAWFPMEPEFQKAVSTEWYEDVADRHPEALITGRVSIRKAFERACDLAEVPRVTPRRLRASFATMLAARGKTREFIRQALAHEGIDSRMQGGESTRPSITERHYLFPSPDLMLASLPRRKDPKAKPGKRKSNRVHTAM